MRQNPQLEVTSLTGPSTRLTHINSLESPLYTAKVEAVRTSTIV